MALKRAHLDSTTTPGTGILPLLPSREERAGERRAVSLANSVVTSSVVPLSPALSPLVPRREREQARAPLVVMSRCAPLKRSIYCGLALGVASPGTSPID